MTATVDTRSAAYDFMWSKWKLSRTLIDGTDAMRAAKHDYLPQFSQESLTSYNRRLARSFLFNAYGFAINNLNGKIFSKPVVLSENMPQQFIDWSEDIDLMGSDITQFAKLHSVEVMSTALSHILVDFPATEPGQTLAQQRASGARPFFRIIRAEDLLFARAEVINGEEVITHARIRENAMEQDGEFGEVAVQRIRVLDPGRVRIFQQGEKEWEVISDTPMLDFQGNPMKVSLVTTYSLKKIFMVSALLLQDLADLNVRHWQSMSDQINVLTFSRFPMVAGTGITDDEADAVILAPNQFLTAGNSQAKFFMVESTGAAVEMGFKDLQRLEEKMMRMAMDPLIMRPGNQTATGRALDSKEANSQLQALALSIEDTLNNCYACMELWTGIPAGTVEVNTDFGVSLDKTSDIDALLKLLFADSISHETLYAELKRRGVLAEDFNIEAEFGRIMDGLSRLNREVTFEAGGLEEGLAEPRGTLVQV